MENNELQHHGILGMKWGVRRFQNRDGSLTPAGKKRRAGEKDELKETKEEYEARKQKAIKSGSAKEILEFKGDLTPNEMRSVAERIRWEQDMQNISAKEVSAGKAKADKFFNKVEDATKYTNTALKAYNTFANIFNAFSNKEISLPKVSTDVDKDNRALRKAEKKKKKEQEEAKKQRQKEEKGDLKKGKNDSSDDTVYEGTVEGEGTSRKTSNQSSKRSKAEDIIYDAEWRDMAVTDLPAVYTSTGQSYVAGLLEESK